MVLQADRTEHSLACAAAVHSPEAVAEVRGWARTSSSSLLAHRSKQTACLASLGMAAPPRFRKAGSALGIP